jgi:transcription factor E2F7/8
MKTPMLSGFNRYSWSVGKSIMKSLNPSGLGGILGTENDENFLNTFSYHHLDDEIATMMGGETSSVTKKEPPVSPTPGQNQQYKPPKKQQQPQQQQEQQEEEEHEQPKHKSIAVLATTFMSMYEHSPVGEKIIVDKTVELLGTERRRIYDLFNVLDSIRLVRKVERQTYEWLGTEHLPYVLGELQSFAVAEYPVEANRFFGYRDYDHWDFGTSSIAAEQNCNRNGIKFTTETGRFFTDSQKGKKVGKDRSMAKLSHDFLKVFLVGHDTLSLQQASDLMQGSTSPLSTRFDEVKDNSVLDSATRKLNMRQQKAKIRRLYDLANIFVSVGLLQKVEAAKIQGAKANRRPDYTWTFRFSAQELRALYNQRLEAGK